MNVKTNALFLAAVFPLALCACGAPADVDTGVVVAEVKLAPTDARCIQLKSIVGAATVTQSFDVAPNSTTVLTLKGLPAGSATIAASAYSLACASVVAASVATYVSDPVVVNVTLLAPVNVAFVMRPNVTAGWGTATIDFAARSVVTETALSPANGQPQGITSGPDGNLWIALRNANKITRVTLAGAMTDYAVPTAGAQPIGIVAGPDGNLWFAENVAGKIGRITPQGFVSEFPLSLGSVPRSLAVGVDGAIWFVDGAKISRITTWGSVTSFPAPSVSLTDLTACTDGNLWFTGVDPDFVGRITPAGVVTTWPQTFDAAGLTCTPDGKVWVVEGTGGLVAQGTTAGFASGVTHIATGVPSIQDLTPGPDGAAWFVGVTGVIGRVTPFAAWPTPRAQSAPLTMTVGPDGAFWFTQSTATAAYVGRLLP